MRGGLDHAPGVARRAYRPALAGERRLGVLGQIRLGSALKWRLKEMGYDEEFIDMATEYLVASVTREPM
jgi:hypothetical protein